MAGTGRTVMEHVFSRVPHADIPRSRFDRSHGLKTTFNAGQLIPIYVDEVLPGDTFNLNATLFGRLSTPIKPFMDNLFLDTFYFFVPNRLIWTNFKRFFGEQDNPADSTSYLVPQATSPAGGYGEMTLQDYMGLPTKVPGLPHNNLHFRAYNLIWNNWFRDQNLQNSVIVDMGDGPDTSTNYVVLPRGKRHDYFTSCLPFPQKGPAVTVPLGTSAVVKPVAAEFSTTGAGFGTIVRSTSGGALVTNSLLGTTPTTAYLGVNQLTPGAAGGAIYLSNLIADLTTAAGTTINQLRQSFQIQKIYERDARGGTRYTELIQAHFGVTSPDARLQRPEYLGGGSSPINVNPIAQTSGTPTTGTPQGNLAAMGTLHCRSGFTKSFTEHGVLIGMCAVRADLNYQDGMNRMWSRQTRFDFYWPALAMIGEQAVLNQEIFAVGSSGAGRTQDLSTFGYQERYAEYRYKPSMITGQFRSNSATPLDIWHLAQHFTALPVLNASFIQDAPPVARVVAVPTEPNFMLDCYFRLQCARPMPVYSVPGFIDHF